MHPLICHTSLSAVAATARTPLIAHAPSPTQRKSEWRRRLGRGGPCSSGVFGGGPRTARADLFAANAPPVLRSVCCTLSNSAAPALLKIRGRRNSGYGQHAWARGKWQEMHVHLAGGRNSWPHRSAMWQEERSGAALRSAGGSSHKSARKAHNCVVP